MSIWHRIEACLLQLNLRLDCRISLARTIGTGHDRLGGLKLQRAPPTSRPMPRQRVDQIVRIARRQYAGQVLGLDEALLLGVAQEREQAVEVAGRVEKAGGLVVDAELVPGDGFEQFVQRAEAAGQGDVGIRERGETLLALVHGGYLLEVDARLPNLGCQIRRDDADYFAAGGHCRFRQRAHQAYPGTAVDDAELSSYQCGC